MTDSDILYSRSEVNKENIKARKGFNACCSGSERRYTTTKGKMIIQVYAQVSLAARSGFNIFRICFWVNPKTCVAR